MSNIFPKNWLHETSTSNHPFGLDWSDGEYDDGSWLQGAIWPIIVIIVLVFAIWSEYGSQDCIDQECNNRSPQFLKNDSIKTKIDITMENMNKNHTSTKWRLALFSALVVSIIIVYYMFPNTMPNGITILVVAAMLFFSIYFASVWFAVHFLKHNDYAVEKSLNELKEKINKRK